MEHMPKEDTTEKKLACLLQKIISDVTSDTAEVSWDSLEVSIAIPTYSAEHSKTQQMNEHIVPLASHVFDLWKSRRHNPQLVKNGCVSVLLEELFQEQDFQKQNHVANEGSDEKQTQEESADQSQHVITDLRLLAAYHVQGSCTLTGNGLPKKIALDGPYFCYSTVSKKASSEKSLIGFLVSPGGWIRTYEEALR